MKVNTYLLATFVISINIFNFAFGFDQDNIEMHGFVSQGFIQSSDNNYLGNSEEGSLEFNEIGLNFAVFVMDDLRFGAQIFSRDLGKNGNNEFQIDWALMDYSYQNWLGIRAGKIKMPFGLYNRKRDADMLRTSVILAQSVYPETIRDLIVGFYGTSIYGSFQIGKLGYMDYEIFVGTLDVPGDTPFILNANERFAYVGSSFSNFMPDDFDLSEITLTIHMRHLEGGMLVWNTFVDGLRFSFTNVYAQLDVSIDTISVDVNLHEYSGISAEYDTRDLTFVLERLVVDAKMVMPGFFSSKISYEGWYSEISWDLLKWMSLNLSYGEYFPSSDDKDGKKIEQGGLADYYAWQKDVSVGVRFNMNEYWCIKFETHFIDGLGLVDLDDNLSGDEERYWRLFAVKTSLNF